MSKRTKFLKLLISLILTAAMLLSVVPFVLFAGAADIDESAHSDSELAEVGAVKYEHRAVPFENLPYIRSDKLNNTIRDFFLDTSSLVMSINETHNLIVSDAYSKIVNSRMSFYSTKPAVVSVNSKGVITAKRNGTCEIIAKDDTTGSKLSCNVHVGIDYYPTQAPTQAPTQFPTNPPKPTQAATVQPTKSPVQPETQAPTAAPTVKPTTAPTQPATQAPVVTETLSLNASSATVYRGCYYHVVAKSNTTVSFSSSNTSVAKVNSNGVVTALSTGSVTITAKTKTKSASCKLNIVSGSSVNISHSTATVDRFMTFLLSSGTSGVKWMSSDTAVATVDKGFVYGAKAGTAVITAYTSTGAATCLMTVESSFPVRFAYTSPNCAAKNQKVTLIAITDTMRTAVRFEVKVGSTVTYVNATSKTKDADTYVWKGTTSFSSSGTYSVKAYSQYNYGTGWYSCKDGETTAFVANSTNMTTTVCAKRRASDDVINLIATFEGYSKSAYADVLTGDPTLGYGRVVRTGEEFYNDLTKAEAYAYLVQTVNNGGYADKVNSFLVDKGVKFNQQQFDALVCFVYNTGTGPLYNDNELISAILNCSDGSSGTKRSYYINGYYVRIRTGPGY